MTPRQQRVVALTREGLSVAQIAQRIGTSQRTVIRERRRAGVAHQAYASFTFEEAMRALTMLEDGASYKEVAKTLGRDRSTIRRWVPGFSWSQEQRREHWEACRRLGKVLQ